MTTLLSKITVLVGLLLLSGGIYSSYAQSNNEYQLATQLLQNQQYNDALPLLLELNADNPDNYIYADRLIDCLIQLKQYERALDIAEPLTEKPDINSLIQIRIGEVYHYLGEEQKALDIWFQNVEEHANQLQIYINTARTMINRREYLNAVDLYKKARIEFNNERLFFGDVANAYMRAGEYELAIDEWLSMLEAAPNQITFIQRSLLRYNDPLLYDITIAELNDQLANISVTDQRYGTFYELQIWLLQENKLFRRALASAKEYESRTDSYNYALFNLGRQLAENNEFELALQAFTYYSDRTFGEVKWRSLEELALTYSKWAKFLDDNRLDFNSTKDSLYQLSSTMLDSIETETQTFSGMANVQLRRAEIALDHVFDPEKAQLALNALKDMQGMKNSPDIPYIEGRIHLSNKEYTQARIAFTRANKLAEIGELAEKTRYFLALTDFYSGDYEFATIQLKSLGRQNTSYYANDALELRLWLQQGLSIDTSGTNLARFADAIFSEQNGLKEQSAEQFLSLVEDPNVLSLKDDAMLHLVRSPYIQPAQKYERLNNFLNVWPNSPIREKLLWEKAKLAEKLAPSASAGEGPSYQAEAREVYETLILQFPQGFYAPYARERLSDLTNPSS